MIHWGDLDGGPAINVDALCLAAMIAIVVIKLLTASINLIGIMSSGGTFSPERAQLLTGLASVAAYATDALAAGAEPKRRGRTVLDHRVRTSYTGLKINDPFLAAHRNGNPDKTHTPVGWEPYPEIQFMSTVEIARELVATYDINEVVGHDDIAPLRKWDPGPTFDMARFRTLVFGDRSEDGDIRMRASSSDGLNLRTGPGIQFNVMRSWNHSRADGKQW